MKLIKKKHYNPGDKKEINEEKIIKDVKFNIFKFNNRIKPSKSNILIFGCFSEFGCEIVGTMYAIPEILKRNMGKYTIAVGWHGREYLYRHLVDEFWEIQEEHMWLREYARAFHYSSVNLSEIEAKLSGFGQLVPSSYLGKIVLGAKCTKCSALWGTYDKVSKCITPNCDSTNFLQSMFADVDSYKKIVKKIPKPSKEVIEEVKQYLGPNPVGIFARNRKCYGRNLQPEFYVKLIDNLKSQGYTPIWLGERQTTLPCPVNDIVDFSSKPESRDLEKTLAIISQLKFTIQFWTASTRLAAIMGVPYILFESPDQIYGRGQEGYRLNLCTFGPRKLVLSHYLKVYNDHDGAMQVINKSISELNSGNYENLIGLVDSEQVVLNLIKENNKRIGI